LVPAAKDSKTLIPQPITRQNPIAPLIHTIHFPPNMK